MREWLRSRRKLSVRASGGASGDTTGQGPEQKPTGPVGRDIGRARSQPDWFLQQQEVRLLDPVDRRPRNRSLVLLLLGALFALIGLVLAIGGAWLAILGGSIYYLLAGIGLVASGVLLIRRRALGAWIYLGIFALTILWAFWEVGLEGWALVPRIIGP